MSATNSWPPAAAEAGDADRASGITAAMAPDTGNQAIIHISNHFLSQIMRI